MMEEPVFVKCETAWTLVKKEQSNSENFEFISKVIPLEQDIKSELTVPGPTQENAFEENFEFVSEMIPLEQDIKSELTVPGPTQENAFERSADIKEEVFIEQHQLFPNVIEEEKIESIQWLPRSDVSRCCVNRKTAMIRRDPMP
ncbi:uncharacterized protein [Anabrus simplex]|uniref:uncharacterized protein n=1 Tax=Anabrus simplex TaxID=316456 RepID=UPI0035A3D522